jgi:hypothetical protein
VQLQTVWAPRVESNKVAYRVLSPTGEDAAVWALIRAKPDALWQGLAQTIWKEYPNSLYARYVVPLGSGREELIRNLEMAISRAPNDLVRQSRQFDLASNEESRCNHLRSSGDLEGAIAACEKARALYLELAENAINTQIRKEAELASYGDRLTRKLVVEQWNVDHGIYPDKIVPIVRCYTRIADGRKKVWFGYNNLTTAGVKDLPIGPQNMLTPAPHDRGQPTHFIDLAYFSFGVIADQPILTWHLYKDKVTVRVAELEECPEEKLQYIPEENKP